MLITNLEPEMLKYFNALKENICCLCVDSDDRGSCTLREDEHCAIQLFLADIVAVAQKSDTNDTEKFKRALNEKICANCKAAENGEFCYLREDANCALDRYFPKIMETIHKVDVGLI